jgi:hypothetical protein
MASEAPQADRGHFAFELKPVPATPTHCRDCEAALEPLRRYAGLCKPCVEKRAKCRAEPRQMRIVRSFVRHGEKHLEVECGCGERRVMRQSTYNAQRPQSCKRCRMRAIARHGFEAEYRRGKTRRIFATRRDK